MHDWEGTEESRPHEDGREGDRIGDPEMPYGMAGVTGILERLDIAVQEGSWTPEKCRAVAEYVLSLADEYWLSTVESAYCRRIMA